MPTNWLISIRWPHRCDPHCCCRNHLTLSGVMTYEWLGHGKGRLFFCVRPKQTGLVQKTTNQQRHTTKYMHFERPRCHGDWGWGGPLSLAIWSFSSQELDLSSSRSPSTSGSSWSLGQMCNACAQATSQDAATGETGHQQFQEQNTSDWWSQKKKQHSGHSYAGSHTQVEGKKSKAVI